MWIMRQLYERRQLFHHLCLLICQILAKFCLLACQGMPVFTGLTNCVHLPLNVLTHGFVLAM